METGEYACVCLCVECVCVSVCDVSPHRDPSLPRSFYSQLLLQAEVTALERDKAAAAQALADLQVRTLSSCFLFGVPSHG